MRWRDYPNFSYAGNQQSVGTNANINCLLGFFFPRQKKAYQPQPQSLAPSLDEIVKTLPSSTLQFQLETRMSIKNFETQVSQLANMVRRMEAQGSGKLPSQAI